MYVFVNTISLIYYFIVSLSKSLYLSIIYIVLMQMAMSAAYMYLLVFSWVFLGDEIKIGVILSDHKFTILRPFTSLQWLIMIYFAIGLFAFIVFIVYTALLAQSSFCALTSPLLYKFSSFLVASWWIGFCVVIGYLIKLFFGSDIASFIHDQTREHTNEEMEERIFRKVFNEYDKDREGMYIMYVYYVCI